MRRIILISASLLALLFVFTTTTSAQDIDCPGLSFERAQEILAENPSDPNGLDRDNDGIACENNASDGGTQSGDTDDAVTTELPDTGSGSAAVSTSIASLLGVMALLVTIVATTVRRSSIGRF